MNHRERFENMMRRKSFDRYPFDLAGTPMTGVESGETVGGLRRLLGVKDECESSYEPFDERVLKRLDIDIRRVGGILQPESRISGEQTYKHINGEPPEHRIIGEPPESRITGEQPARSRRCAAKRSRNRSVDCWGVTRVYTGMYWDIVDPPLRGADSADLDKYPWPRAEDVDPQIIETYKTQARRLYNETDYVVCAEHPFYGVFELGCWMCGFDDFLLKMALDPPFVRKFFDIILEYQLKAIDIYYGALGDYINLTTSGDDFGMQTGPMISPAMFKEAIAPYYAERIRRTKKYVKGWFFHHTCGSVYDLIPYLIEAGVDILNPIQPGAKDMEPEKLSAAFGDSIAFWGGVDTQRLLPAGTPGDVRRETIRLLEIMSSRPTPFVLAPAHNIQPDVPAENIKALFDAGREFYRR